MEQKTNRFGLATKIVAIVLLIIFCFACVGSLSGIVIALDSELYSSGETDIVRSSPVQMAVDRVTNSDIELYALYLHSYKSDESYHKLVLTYENKLSAKNSNVLFKITDLNGNLIASNTDSELDDRTTVNTTASFVTRSEPVISTYYFESYDDATDFIDSYENGEWYDIQFSGPYRCKSEEHSEEETEAGQWEASGERAVPGPTEQATNSDERDESDTNYPVYDIQNESTNYYVTLSARSTSYDTYNISASVNPSLPANDRISSAVAFMNFINIMKYHFIYIFFAALILCVVLTAMLCSMAGRRKGEVGVRANLIDKIPLDLVATVYIFVGSILAVFISEIVYRYYYSIILNVILSALALLAIGILTLSLILTFATRVKLGRWWQNTLLYKLYAVIKKYCLIFLSFIGRCLRNMHSLLKGLIFFAAILLTDMLFMIDTDSGFGFTVWFARTSLLLVLVLMVSLELSSLRKGGKKIADGDLDVKIETKNLHGSYKEIGESFNNIGEGLSKAVQEQTKSERMKAELITNVSHDIKTPLTCIINYVDLLKKEGSGSEQAKEYLDILDRQSMRLKKLTEDLVEASKASTGNIQVELSEIDINLLLSQAIGEYEEKLGTRKISVISSFRENAHVNCDGRLLWRVFDNLLSNIFKYAQESTRVYVTTETQGGKVSITFKNISGYQLNISPDELTERFVRGDSSRNTEGSGLGLSIAKSLTELQGGSFNIDIDGDLFKTTITFDGVMKA